MPICIVRRRGAVNSVDKSLNTRKNLRPVGNPLGRIMLASILNSCPSMIDPQALENWLSSANARYRADEVPPRHRPFKAMSDFTREFNCSLALDSPIAKAIFDWFYKHSQRGSHVVGALFTGAYYFDACFWPLYIPLGYGTFSLNALNCLETMPEVLKKQISQSREDLWQLALYWADCCDYAYGVDDIGKEGKLSKRRWLSLRMGIESLLGRSLSLWHRGPIPGRFWRCVWHLKFS